MKQSPAEFSEFPKAELAKMDKLVDELNNRWCLAASQEQEEGPVLHSFLLASHVTTT